MYTLMRRVREIENKGKKNQKLNWKIKDHPQKVPMQQSREKKKTKNKKEAEREWEINFKEEKFIKEKNGYIR